MVSRDALLLVGKPDFYDAAKIVPIIVLSYIVFGMHYHMEIGIMISKKTKYLAYINMGNAALNIGLNFLLIPKYGAFGAAYATLVCFINKVGWTRWISNRLYPLQFEYGRILKIVVSAGFVFLIAWFIPYPASFSQYMSDYASHATDLRILGAGFILLRSGIVLSYVGILLLIGFWLPEEKEYAWKMLKIANDKLPSRLQFNSRRI